MEEIVRLYQKHKHVTNCRALSAKDKDEVSLLFRLATTNFKLTRGLSTCNPIHGLGIISRYLNNLGYRLEA